MKKFFLVFALWPTLVFSQSLGPPSVTTALPIGAAGGVLAGTYPNPSFASSPSFVTPNINVASGTSLALGGCTIGVNVFCAVGTSVFNGNAAINGIYSSALSPAGLNVSGVIPGIAIQDSNAAGDHRNFGILNSYSSPGILSFTFSAAAGGAPTSQWLNVDAVAGTSTFGLAVVMGAQSSGANTNVLCLNTGTGAVTYQPWVTGCAVSALRFKELLPIQGINVAGIDDLRVVPWRYKSGVDMDDKVHIGLLADDVEQLDRRCVSYDKDGIQNYEDRCLIAYLVAARKADHAEFLEYKALHP